MRNIIKYPLPFDMSDTVSGPLNAADVFEARSDLKADFKNISIPPLSSVSLRSLEAAGATHVGKVRHSNEDSFYLETFKSQGQDQAYTSQAPPNADGPTSHLKGIFILCDGMGGHDQGEVASSMATYQLAQSLIDRSASEFITEIGLKSSIYQTNQVIHQENLQQHQLGLRRMGTTVVVAATQDRTVRIGHVGDSRCYRVTHRFGLEQLTQDHELAQDKILKGMDPKLAYAEPNAKALTQALGPRPNHLIAPDIQTLEIQEDSLFLLCSDGLSDNQLVESAWVSYLKPYLSQQRSLSKAAAQLVDLALRRNGHDNITVVLFRALL